MNDGNQGQACAQLELRQQIEEEQHVLLLPYALGAMVVLWLWYIVLAQNRVGQSQSGVMTRADGAVVILALGIAIILWARESHPATARWALILAGLAVVVVLRPALQPGLAMATAALWIVMASALVSTWQAGLAVGLLAATEWLIGLVAPPGSATGLAPVERIIVYALLFVAIWWAHHPLHTSVDRTLAAWAHASEALTEARSRRGELNRALHALEEATYRIEHTNSELLLARREAELAKANKARFVATVSHELRGPLNLILGFSRLMALSPERYDAPLPRVYRADLDTIYANSQLVVDLVDDILDLSQIEAEQLPIVKDRVDLGGDVIAEAIELVRPLAERKGLFLQVEMDDALPPILADRTRLRQVVMNLLTNAIRYTQRGGILVRTRSHTEGILVMVQDTGQGIPAEQMPKLFQAFSRLRPEEHSQVKGSGLGLAISKSLIQLHGGRIWAESTEGQGTSVCFTLPLPNGEPIARQTVLTGGERRAPTPYETCLVVGHRAEAIRLLARHIEGYRVVGLPDEQTLLPLVEDLHPRAIIATPENEAKIARLLAEASLDVPVLGCRIAHGGAADDVRGARVQLIKPIVPEVLHVTLNQMLGAQGTPTVLLVDDDLDTVRLLEMMLRASLRTYQVLKAYDGQEALAIMAEKPPDMVLLDLIMPGLDGWGTLARMQADPALAQIPVLILSACDALDEASAFETPLTVRTQHPLETRSGIRCLRALLEVLTPNYLSRPKLAAQHAPALLGGSAS